MIRTKTFHMALIRHFIVVVMLLACIHEPVLAKDDEYINLPMPQKFIPTFQADGSPKYVSDSTIETTIRKFSPDLKKFYHNQKITRFIVPEHRWLDHLLAAYDAFLSEVGVKAKADTWDCENYSGMLNSLTTLRIWRAGYLDTRAAIGWLRVDAKHEWAGLPGVMHALMFAVTSEGVFIIEPQNGKYINLAKYPNRQYIQEVILF